MASSSSRLPPTANTRATPDRLTRYDTKKSVRFDDAPPLVHLVPSTSQGRKATAKDEKYKNDLLVLLKQADLCKAEGAAEVLDDIHVLKVPERIKRILQLHKNRNTAEARGLEIHLSSRYNKRCAQQQLQCINVVLNDQQDQRETQGRVSESWIAEVAMKHSHSARVMARVLALADEQYVKHLERQEEERPHERQSPRVTKRKDSMDDNSGLTADMDASGMSISQSERTRMSQSEPVNTGTAPSVRRRGSVVTAATMREDRRRRRARERDGRRSVSPGRRASPPHPSRKDLPQQSPSSSPTKTPLLRKFLAKTFLQSKSTSNVMATTGSMR